jgi:hypothetical protein
MVYIGILFIKLLVLQEFFVVSQWAIAPQSRRELYRIRKLKPPFINLGGLGETIWNPQLPSVEIDHPKFLMSPGCFPLWTPIEVAQGARTYS